MTTIDDQQRDLMNEFEALRYLDQDNKKLSINSESYPEAALELEYIRTPSITNLLKTLQRYENDKTFTPSTCNVLRNLLDVMGSQDHVLASLDKQTAREQEYDYYNSIIIARCSVPREDRDTNEFINFEKQMKFAYKLLQSRAKFDDSGFNERSRKHIKIGEQRHKLESGSGAPKRKRGFIDFMLRRHEQPKEGNQG